MREADGSEGANVMNGRGPGRFSWLTLHSTKMSRWLNVYLYASFPFILIPPILIEMHHNGGNFVRAYQTIGNEQGAYRMAALLVFVVWAILVWFTFFTKSKQVTDGDKFHVFIGTFAWAAFFAVLIARSGYLSRLFI